MKAIVFDAPGAPEVVLRVRDIDMPDPARGEVLVRVTARPIQPSDLMFIAGRYRIKPTLPQVAGLEGAGSVVATGEGVEFALGTRVTFRHPGSWAEYARVPVSEVCVVPEDISEDDAAQFHLNPVTAWGVLETARVEAGDWIAVNAPTSTVAQLIINLARLRNIHVVTIARAASPFATDASAAVIDTANLSEHILAVTCGKPVDALLDAVGGVNVTRSLPALKQGATIVSYGLLGGEPAAMSNADMIYRNLHWQGFGINQWLEQTSSQQREKMVDSLWRAIAEGSINLPVIARFTLDDIREAVDAAHTASGIGKVLLCTA